MTTPIFGLSDVQMVFYQQDLEEASRRGTVPSREEFRKMLGLDLILGIRVDYDRPIQAIFPRVMSDYEVEGLRPERSSFWAVSQSVGNNVGLRMVQMKLLDLKFATAVSDIEHSLAEQGSRYATLGEGLHFLSRNPGAARRFPFVTVHTLPSGERGAVFIGSLSGGESRVIRFKPIDLKWRGCRHLIVTT